MAIVLSALGAFLYVRLERSLTAGIDESLELRSAALAADLRRSAVPYSVGPAGDEGIAQVFDHLGALLSSSPADASFPYLLSREDVARARLGSFTLRRNAVDALDGEPARVLVTPIGRGADDITLAVGISLEDQEDALGSLLAELLIVGPLALLLASIGGYFLAAAALRPVEAMRCEAEAVSASRPDARLSLPPAKDEISRLGRTLNAMLDRLEAGLVRERQFVADASHELRTPLSLLRAELELALRRPRTHEELEEALRSAADESERLWRLADDLLVLAQLDDGALAIRPSELSCRDLLEAVARRSAGRAEAEGRAIEVDVDGGCAVTGDPVRLEQALGNLVDNALRHGGGTVRLTAAEKGDVVELRVADEGYGFPADFVPYAFDRFSRADTARTSDAAGLGLAIVAAIAGAHGGVARAGNAGNGGAVVSLALPARSSLRAPEPPPRRA